VPIYAYEHFLHEILGTLAIADCSIDEVQESCLIAINQLLKCALFTRKEGAHDSRVVETPELFSDGSACRNRGYFQGDVSHWMLSPG
jgi:hypothetical protein